MRIEFRPIAYFVIVSWLIALVYCLILAFVFTDDPFPYWSRWNLYVLFQHVVLLILGIFYFSSAIVFGVLFFVKKGSVSMSLVGGVTGVFLTVFYIYILKEAVAGI